MKQFMYIGLVFVLLAGCSASKTYKQDYLKGDDWEAGTWSDAMETIKKDYLNAPKTKRDRIREKGIEALAQATILKTEFKNDYDATDPLVDLDVGMTQAHSYYFVHFPAFEGREDINDTTYLIVIRRFNDSIAYQGVFDVPKGDPFYRYNEVINSIENP